MNEKFSELCISQYGTLLWQQACLSLNDRTIILSKNDQLSVITLLARANGHQCSHAEVVRIAEVLSERYEIRAMCSSDENSSNDTMSAPNIYSTNAECCLTTIELAAILTAYDKYLLDFNATDVNRVILMVIDAHKSSERLKSLLLQQQKTLLRKTGFCQLEKRLADIVFSSTYTLPSSGDDEAEATESVQAATSSNTCVTPGSPLVSCTSPVKPLNECVAGLHTSTPHTPTASLYSAHSKSWNATLQVFYDYLSLIVNTRCQLSLARAVNCPDRGINHAAFTELKHLAQSRNMPLYQMIVSYVTRLRLGGQGYAPDPSNPLTNHVKGLSEFTDLMHKLLAVVEEGTNSLRAVSRVVTVLAGTLRRGGVASDSVDAAVKHMTYHASLCSHLLEVTAGVSPAKVTKMGGTMGGLSTIRLLRLMVNIHAASSIHESQDQSSTTGLHSSTPQSSVVTLFTSPDEEQKAEEQPVPLRQRVAASLSMRSSNSANSHLKKSTVVRHFSTTAASSGQVIDNCSKPLISDFLSCKTLVTSSSGCKRPTSSAEDKENIAPPGVNTLLSLPQQNKKSKVTGSQSSNTSKGKTGKASGKGQGKTAVLSQGQKQLTAFFR